MKKWIFCGIVAVLSTGVFCACGGDDEDAPSEGVSDGTGDGGSAGQKVDIVGRTIVYNQDSEQYGYQNSMMLTLKFTSSSKYSIKKDSWYFEYSNGAYRQCHYEQTKTGNYSVHGNTITMQGNWPFWDGSRSERWDSDDWQLVYQGSFLTNVGAPHDPIWTFL